MINILKASLNKKHNRKPNLIELVRLFLGTTSPKKRSAKQWTNDQRLPLVSSVVDIIAKEATLG